jgi:hypothetical protein
MTHAVRRFPRIPVELPVQVSTIDPEVDPASGRPYFRDTLETCANLSPGGAFIRTLDPPAPGRRLLLQLEVPGVGTIDALGRVAWVKRVVGGSGVGVEFLRADHRALARAQQSLGRDEDAKGKDSSR